MTKTKIITLICWSITALALLAIIALVIFGVGVDIQFMSFGDWGSFDVERVEYISPGDIDSININWTSGRVNVIVHDGDDIIITEQSRRELRTRHQMTYTVADGELNIRFVPSGTRGSIPSKRLEVQVPQNMLYGLSAFEVLTVSGRITLNGVDASDVTLRTTSGRITVNDVDATNIDLRTTSGRIEARRVTAESIRSHTVSGRHSLSGAFGDVNMQSTSGRLYVSSSIVPERIEARAVSGRIRVAVPNDGTPIHVDHRSNSGRFSSAMPIITGGGNAQFTLRTTSGRITIAAY